MSRVLRACNDSVCTKIRQESAFKHISQTAFYNSKTILRFASRIFQLSNSGNKNRPYDQKKLSTVVSYLETQQNNFCRAKINEDKRLKTKHSLSTNMKSISGKVKSE
ncbi:hypothetical protein CH360_12535 [Leptospira perolatii]|uniref:Uncharacterized protein n=1 Tax=Leptospira perolatii TaxID=2023191 RepID=A0ABX4P8U0_9LEPT|nr:hypothetical protein CH360_12535 [Leptospira perolatii]